MTTLYGGLTDESISGHYFTLHLAGTSTPTAPNSFEDTDIISSATIPGANDSNGDNGDPPRKVIFDNYLAPSSTAYGFWPGGYFYNFQNTENLDMSNVTTIENMFRCSIGNGFNFDVSNGDVSKITNMYGAFSIINGAINPDVSNGDVSNVTNMGYMFNNSFQTTSPFNPDVSNGDVSNVTNMAHMFKNCSGNSFNPDVSNGDVSNVIDMSSMFRSCSGSSFNPDVSHGNVSNVTNMALMFYDCHGNSFTQLNLNSGDVSNVTDMSRMFYGCTKLETIYCNSTGEPTNSNDMFLRCSALIGEEETEYNADYVDASYAKLDKSNSPGYFSYSPIGGGISQDNKTFYLSGIETENATNNFDDRLSDNNNHSVNSIPWQVSNLTSPVERIIIENKIVPIKTCNWFVRGENGKTTEDVGGHLFDTSNVTDMGSMFFDCSNTLFNPDFSKGNVSNVTNMGSMFAYCSGDSFNPDLNNGDISSVTNMLYMFDNCSGNSFNPKFSKGDVSNVTDMSDMFRGCSTVSELNFKNGNINSNCYQSEMFDGCTSLKKIILGSNGKFRPGCGLSDPIEQEIPNQNGSKYSGKGIRTKDINDRLDPSSRGLSANELIGQYTGSASMTGTYEGEILHPTYIKIKNAILNTYGNSDNHLITPMELPTSIPVELKEYHSLQVAADSFDTYYYPVSETQWIIDGQYSPSTMPTDYMLATKTVVIEINFEEGQYPNYPAAPAQLPQTVPENAIFKGGTTDFEHLYTDKDIGELEDLTLYAVYFVYKKILEQKIRNPLEPSEGLTVDIFYQDDKGNIISQKELNKDEDSLHLDYNILLQEDIVTLNKTVQINFPLDNFITTVGEPSTEGTASDTQQQGNFGDNINNIDYLIPDANNKIKEAQIRKAQLPTPIFPTPIAVSNTAPSDALIGIETN